jgi:hypothetical protein
MQQNYATKAHQKKKKKLITQSMQRFCFPQYGEQSTQRTIKIVG